MKHIAFNIIACNIVCTIFKHLNKKMCFPSHFICYNSYLLAS